MGSRCWGCGEKSGRCYEHGGMCNCPTHSCPSSSDRVVNIDFDDDGPVTRVKMRPVTEDEVDW